MTIPPFAFDPGALAESAEYTLEEDLRGLLETFFESLESFLEELSALPREEIRFRAHRLASGAWAVGIPDLGDEAAALDRALGRPLTDDEERSAVDAFGQILTAAVRTLDVEAILKTLYPK
jgi:HPt (histidine-containing phosphotransfer) domain-containing protein